MQHDIHQLFRISQKTSRTILGLMSGTSLDGLDLALCRFSGAGVHTSWEILKHTTLPYPPELQADIRRVFAKPEVNLPFLAILNEYLAETHAQYVNKTLQEWQIPHSAVDAIASHGQTVMHAPRQMHGMVAYPNASLQIADGDHLARQTGIITLSDFRQKHLAFGGEGAPLVLFGDYLLFSNPFEDRFMLNIGGIANFTYLPASQQHVFATDTGPGNTLIDAYCRKLFDVPYDEDGRIAAAGIPDPALLEAFLEDPFFQRTAPKTTGPEQFSMTWAESIFARHPKGRLNPYDQIATLTCLTAKTIAHAMKTSPESGKPKAIYLSGGGANNNMLIKHLKQLLPAWEISPVDKLGMPGTAKEAVLFALLANETLAGSPLPNLELGGLPYFTMGKISLPH